MSIAICLLMITSISTPFTQNAGQPQNVGQSQNIGQSTSSSSGTGGLADSPWPMFRQNLNHTGLSPYNTSGNNGQLKWSFTTGGGVSSSPAIGSDGTIYVGSGDNKLYAINPNGTKKWDYTTGESFFESSPAIGSDGSIYIGSADKKIYAINPDGTEKWNFTTGGSIQTSSPAIGLDGTIYIGCYGDGKLYAIEHDGNLKWTFSTGGGYGIRSSPAIGSDGTIYIGSGAHKLHAINPDGSEKWSYYTGGYVLSSPAIDSDGIIYVGSYDVDPSFHAIYPDGTLKWSYTPGKTIASSPAIGSDGTIYVGCCDKKLHAINPDGTEKWSFLTGNCIHSSPAIGSDGTIYVGSQDHNIYAINPDGTQKWNFTIESAIVTSSPAIGSDGTIYIGSHGYKLYAIGTPNLIVNITSHFTELNSAAQSSITVQVTDGTNPVQGATVNLVSDNGGIFSPQSGITDANGDFKSIFNSPTVTTQLICKISAEATKTGYNNGSGYVDITINPIPWPMYSQNCMRTGISPYDTSSNPGKLKWSFTTGGFVMSPVIGHDETIYVASHDEKLYAINPDGSQKWNFTIDGSIPNSPTISSDGTIYTGSGIKNKLYALDTSGIEIWNFTANGRVSSPAIGSDGSIYFSTSDNPGPNPLLYALNSNGTEKWRLTIGVNGRGYPPAIGSDGTIYVGTGEGKLYAVYPNGTEKWIFSAMDNMQDAPAIGSDGTIYIASEDQNLYAINPDGSEKWRFNTEDSSDSSPAIGYDGTIYIGSNNHNLYAINPNGTEKWRFTANSLVQTSPAIGASGIIYFGSDDFNLYAINPDGTERWNFTTGFVVHSSPAIGTDGTIYIGSFDKKLYAIREGGIPPIAEAGPDQTVNEGDIVQFNGSGSSGGGSGFLNAVALWHMNEGSGSIIHDETANHNEGTIIGANWVDGKFGKALYFDGLNDFVEVLDSASLDITDKITIEAWIKPVITGPGSTTYMYVVCKELHPGYPTKGGAYTLDIYPGKARSAGYMDFGGVLRPFKVIGSTDIIDNIWQYIAVIWNGTVAKIFYNGQLEGAINLTGNIASTDANVGIGRYGRVFFNGVIDEVVIYNRAISDNEVFDYYNHGKEHYVGSSGDPTEIVSYEWDFDSSDGLWWETGAVPDATGPIPTHVYGDNGVYTVTLRVTDDTSDKDMDTCIISVNNVAPTITLLRTYPDDEGSRVTFEVESTDPGSDDVTYSWELEYGPTIENTYYNDWVGPEPLYDPAHNEIKSPSGTYPFHTSDVATHIYGDNYDYTITLTVTDDDGGESTATTTVTVDNLAPSIIEINIPSQIDEGSSPLYEILASDQGSDDLTFTWDFELGPTITNVHYNDGVGLDPYPSPWGDYPFDVWDSVDHIYGDDGVYTLSLSIEDDDGGITTYSTDIPVRNVAPTIETVTVPGGDEGAVLTFSSIATDLGSDDITFTWNWGDGSLETMNTHYNDDLGPDPPLSPLGNYPFTTTETVSHIYGDNGNYTITLTVEDDDGGQATYTTTVIIDNVAPTIEPFGPFTVDEGSLLELFTTSTDPGSDDLTFTWEFELGPTITNVYYNDGVAPDPYPSPWGAYPCSASDSAEHTYGDNGIFPVTLTVTDDDGGFSTYITNITVNNVAPTIASIEAHMYVNFSLRVAGEKYHSVGIHLYEDDVEIWNAQVTRQPGSPDKQAATLSGYSITLGSSYTAIVDYLPNDPRINGNVWGGNPVWIILEFQDGTTEKLHHTFNVRQSYWDSDHWNHIDPWEVDLTGVIYRHNITFEATASDPGSDDLTFLWDFGDGGTAGPNTYFNNGVNPDPYPSPEINPMSASDTVLYAYAASGIYTVTLSVMDDDGGIATATLVIVLPG